MGVTRTLAAFVSGLDEAPVPAEVVEHAKGRVLDTLATMIGGSRERCTEAAAAVCQPTARGDAAVVGRDGRWSASDAAFVNGVAAHALDYDDLPVGALNHVSAVVLPAVLALVEARGGDGRSVLTGLIAGYELGVRLTRAVPEHFFAGWAPQGTIGCVAAAAGASAVLGLAAERVEMALGLAGATASGVIKHYGTMTKPYVVGNAARNGVMAALLAERDFTAPHGMLDPVQHGPHHSAFGFAATFNQDRDYDAGVLTDGLGTHWHLPDTLTKHHPGATAGFVAVDLVLELAALHDVDPAAVRRVEVRVDPFIGITSQGADAADEYEARYSLWYVIAATLLDRALGPAQFRPERVRRADVRDLRERVTVIADEALRHAAGTDPMLGRARARIELTDGTIIEGAREAPAATVRDWDAIATKFRECAVYAGYDPADPRLTDTVSLVAALDTAPRADALLAGIGAPAQQVAVP